MSIDEKRCSGPCGQVKPLEDFYKNEGGLGGRHSRCKDCMSLYQKGCSKKNKERKAARAKVWYQNNRDARRAANKVYRNKNKEAESARKKLQRKERNHAIRVYNCAYMKRKRERDPIFRALDNLRTRLYSFIKGRNEAATTIELVGCGRADLMLHLQAQFRSPMNWNNYGPLWHVDHIRPCKSYNLRDVEEQKQCFHWSNLQPLFGSENFAKGATYKDVEQ
jgi:hypothetical protein